MAKSETWLKFGKESEEKYAAVNDRGFGGKLSNIQLFMLAASFGFSSGRRVSEFSRSSTGPRTTIRDEHLAYLSCIHVSVTKDPSALLDSAERDRVAEEFAEGGIRLLHEKLLDPTVPSFVNWLISEIRS